MKQDDAGPSHPARPGARRHACDECYVRKVRCDRNLPCSACVEAMHPCTHNIKRKRMGPPKGSGKVNSKLRTHLWLQASRSQAGASSVPAADYLTTPTPESCDTSTVGTLDYQHENLPALGSPPADYFGLNSAALEPTTPDSGRLDLDCNSSTTSDFDPVITHKQAPRSYPALYNPPSVHGPRIPLAAYIRFLHIYQTNLYPIWPIVPVRTLLARIHRSEVDAEAYSLAASLCAATISQLRLKEHFTQSSSPDTVTSHQFATESQMYRNLDNFRERESLETLLTSFFLHIYFANVHKLTAAGFYLRESVGFAQAMRLHDQEEITDLSEDDERRLRIYWVLFVSERTFGMQNNAPIVMRPIERFPSSREDESEETARVIACFGDLARLFTLVRGSFVDACRDTSDVAQVSQEDVSYSQYQLSRSTPNALANEAQKVDIILTRNWIQTMFWRYSLRRFPMSMKASDQALSFILPLSLARDTLGILSNASKTSIHAHGYGMELKVFRIADALVDVILSAQNVGNCPPQLSESQEALNALRVVLSSLGEEKSTFVTEIDDKILQTKRSAVLYKTLPPPMDTTGVQGLRGAEGYTLTSPHDGSQPQTDPDGGYVSLEL